MLGVGGLVGRYIKGKHPRESGRRVQKIIPADLPCNTLSFLVYAILTPNFSEKTFHILLVKKRIS
jgi:hypothetical protein